MRTVTEHSAGGVIVRDHEGTRICLIRVRARGGGPSWRLPKGLLARDETPEQAAAREVREETGCSGHIVADLEPIEYWYVRPDRGGEKVRVKKRLDVFLLEYLEGDTADHDREVEEARWFSADKALETIYFDSERKTIEQALSMRR